MRPYPRVAYIMSRFPKLTETFILREILAVVATGIDVQIYPLMRERVSLVQPEVERLLPRVHYQPFISLAIIGTQLHFILAHPRRYVSTLIAVIRVTWGSVNFLWGALAIFPKAVHVARLLQADRVDLVHCHFASHPAMAGFIIRRMVDIPFSFTAHGSDLHKDRHGLCAKVREAGFVVAISRYNQDVIVRECGSRDEAKIEIVHCGVDPAEFPPPSDDGGAVLRILCIGTLHEVKGQAHLIEACRLLAASGVSFVCHFVGDGADRAELTRQVSAAGLEGQVVLRGLQAGPEVREELAWANVLVAPSVPSRDGRREGIPVVLMEGMAAGLPVVASDLSGIPELVEDGRSGLLVPPGDSAGIAAALTQLSGDPALRRRMSDAGRERVEREFNVHASARRLAVRFRAATDA